MIDLKGEKESDIIALKKSYITITPIQYDLTNHGFIEELKTWNIKKTK